MTDGAKVIITHNGPYMVEGQIPLVRKTIVTDAAGESVDWRQDVALDAPSTYYLCRCGHSADKPFCDGSHERVGFDGTETANMEPYIEQAEEQVGPRLVLTDAPSLCAFARFCDVGGQIWNLVERPGTEASDLAIQEAANCPSGRLVVWDRQSGLPIEPELDVTIAVTSDPGQGVAGPLWLQGGIPLTSPERGDYETRNRVTLCRCGASQNKPYCDASHATVRFVDERAPLA